MPLFSIIADVKWATFASCESFNVKDIGAEQDVGEVGSEPELLGDDLAFNSCPSIIGPRLVWSFAEFIVTQPQHDVQKEISRLV